VTIRACALNGAEYPARLRDLPNPPAVVFVTGELPRGPSVAIVGTRTPTAEGTKFARNLAHDLAKEGVVVISGGAVGIDTAAHQGALVAGGMTLVVAPSSFDRPFPDTNAALFAEIVARGGAYLTEHEAGITARRHQFFARNSLLAALADALVVVETRFRGGARNAAKAARELGRPVLAVPGPPWTPTGAGCILELKAGARIASSAHDVLAAIALRSLTVGHHAPRRDDVPSRPVEDPPESGEPQGDRPAGRMSQVPLRLPDPEREMVVGLLSVGPLWPDEICRKTGLPAHRLQALLLTLTLESVVVSEPSGRVSLVNR
jgi:DNA processing protein